MSELSTGSAAAATGSNALVIWRPVEPAAAAAPPHTPRPAASYAVLQRTVRVAKLALMIWGGISLTAAGGYAVGEVLSGPEQLKGQALAPAQPPQPAVLAAVPAAEPAPDAAPKAAGTSVERRQVGTSPDPASSKAATRPAAPVKPRLAAAAPAGAGPREADAPPPVRRAAPLTNADDIGVAGGGFTPRSGLEVRGGIANTPLPEEDATVAARVPRPRPDDPVITGSIDRQWAEVRRPRRWERRIATWRDRELRRIQRLPRYIVIP